MPTVFSDEVRFSFRCGYSSAHLLLKFYRKFEFRFRPYGPTVLSPCNRAKHKLANLLCFSILFMFFFFCVSMSFVYILDFLARKSTHKCNYPFVFFLHFDREKNEYHCQITCALRAQIISTSIRNSCLNMMIIFSLVMMLLFQIK